MPFPASNLLASLRRISTVCDGPHPVSGPKGRRFKSSRPDKLKSAKSLPGGSLSNPLRDHQPRSDGCLEIAGRIRIELLTVGTLPALSVFDLETSQADRASPEWADAVGLEGSGAARKSVEEREFLLRIFPVRGTAVRLIGAGGQSNGRRRFLCVR